MGCRESDTREQLSTAQGKKASGRWVFCTQWWSEASALCPLPLITLPCPSAFWAVFSSLPQNCGPGFGELELMSLRSGAVFKKKKVEKRVAGRMLP